MGSIRIKLIFFVLSFCLISCKENGAPPCKEFRTREYDCYGNFWEIEFCLDSTWIEDPDVGMDAWESIGAVKFKGKSKEIGISFWNFDEGETDATIFDKRVCNGITDHFEAIQQNEIDEPILINNSNHFGCLVRSKSPVVCIQKYNGAFKNQKVCFRITYKDSLNCPEQFFVDFVNSMKFIPAGQ